MERQEVLPGLRAKPIERREPNGVTYRGYDFAPYRPWTREIPLQWSWTPDDDHRVVLQAREFAPGSRLALVPDKYELHMFDAERRLALGQLRKSHDHEVLRVLKMAGRVDAAVLGERVNEAGERVGIEVAIRMRSKQRPLGQRIVLAGVFGVVATATLPVAYFGLGLAVAFAYAGHPVLEALWLSPFGVVMHFAATVVAALGVGWFASLSVATKWDEAARES